MNQQTREILTAVFKELKAMSRDEFLKELELNGNGDIASFLLESGALEVRTVEAEAFAHSTCNNISASIDCKTVHIGSLGNFHTQVGRTYLVEGNDTNYGLIGKPFTESTQMTMRLPTKIIKPVDVDWSIKEENDGRYAIAC